jgi:methionyl-tRNA synthetase
MNKKYISTTLPYGNAGKENRCGHIGHAFEFVLADVIAEYYRLKLGRDNVFFNVGVDEHGQKIYQKAIESGFTENETQLFCDVEAQRWAYFCSDLRIDYNNFYRTTDQKHKDTVLRFYNDIKQFTYRKEYEGEYCVGCESFITEKEIVNGNCPIHKTPLEHKHETNLFFDLNKFSPQIKDVLVDKSISPELTNILKENFDLSITRQNVKWGIETPDGDVFYVWAEALLCYIAALGFYEDRERFDSFWQNSLIICGKDNLKFQAYILQALLLANNIPQTKEVLVHGIILDEKGDKMSKTVGNVIDPIAQVEKHGLDAVRYYLCFGLNTFGDSKYSESDLVNLWNNDVVNGLGNLIARLFHLIDLREVELNESQLSEEINATIESNKNVINTHFDLYNFKGVRDLLNSNIDYFNYRITNEKPFAKNCDNYSQILNEIYFSLKSIIPYYKIVLKSHSDKLTSAFDKESPEKVIIFERK